MSKSTEELRRIIAKCPEEAAKKRLSADEMRGLLNLFAGLNALKEAELVNSRITEIEGARRLYMCGWGMIRRLSEKIVDSMPMDQVLSLRRNLKTLRYSISVARPGGKDYSDDGRWLSYTALDVLVGAAQDTCLMCMKDKQEQRKCPLAKAFDELPCSREDFRTDGCRYFNGLS